MWKGDYWNLQSGAEIGLYSYNREVTEYKQYDAIDYEIPMELSLFNYDNSTEKIECLFNWKPGVYQWWVTGFNPRFKEANPEKMTSIGKLKLEDNKDLYYVMKENCENERNYIDIKRKNFVFDDENYCIWVYFGNGEIMKKILSLFLMVICMIFNITACGVKSNNTSKSPLRQTKDMAENVYDAIKNHDSEQLKEQFCERLQPGKETAVDKIYEYIDGEIETLETDFETDNYADTGGGENRGDKLSKGFSFGIYVVSDKGTRYEIVGKGDVINTIEPKNQGLQTIIIYRQNEDGTWNYKNNVFRVGSELD